MGTLVVIFALLFGLIVSIIVKFFVKKTNTNSLRQEIIQENVNSQSKIEANEVEKLVTEKIETKSRKITETFFTVLSIAVLLSIVFTFGC
jgi:hypothetical protein